MSFSKRSREKESIFTDEDEFDDDIPDGDPFLGQSLYKIHCSTCHDLDASSVTGPPLRDIYNRRAGKVKNFHYSKTLARGSFNWTKKRLFLFLENPEAMFPDTQMSFDGMNDPWKRACIIEYLRFLKDQKK